MCGRYALDVTGTDLAAVFGAVPGTAEAWSPSWNVTPSSLVPVIRRQASEIRVDLLRWGLVPAWSGDPGVGARMINARSETIRTRPSFRDSFRDARCLVPIRGFYEWTGGGRRRRPMAVRAVDGGLLALAGVWARSVMDDGTMLETFSIVTSDAGPTLARIHHRMPVILRDDDADRWLDARHPADGGPSAEELESMLARANDRGLRVHPDRKVSLNFLDAKTALWTALPGLVGSPGAPSCALGPLWACLACRPVLFGRLLDALGL